MQVITTQQTTAARSRISDEIVINYTSEQQDDKPTERINGRILKNDIVAGYFNANRSGESGLTFVSGSFLTADEKQEISSAVYQDEAEFFNEGGA